MSRLKKSTKIVITGTISLVLLGGLFVYRSVLLNQVNISADINTTVTLPPVPDTPPADDTTVTTGSTTSSTTTSTTSKTSPCAPYGDVNQDGKITTDDATMITSSIAGSVTLTSQQKLNADVTAQNNIDSGDATMIQNYLSGIITTFPVCTITKTTGNSSTTTTTNAANTTATINTQRQVAAADLTSTSEGSASYIMAQSVKSGISFPVIVGIILVVSGLLIFQLLRGGSRKEDDLIDSRKKLVKTALKALVILIVVSGTVYLVSSYQSLGTVIKLKFNPNVLADDAKSTVASQLQALPMGTTKISPGMTASLDAFQNNHLYYPKFGIDAPVSFGVSDTMTDEMLKQGLVQLAKSATPDIGGDVLIAGHSSYYSWVASDFKTVFAPLVNAGTGDDILLKKGNVLYLYTVKNIQTIGASDKITVNVGNQYPKKLDLITCVPIGTNLRRLLIKADFVRRVKF